MKRLLLIAYYWPPAGGAGVLRWLRFCHHLPAHGWQPTVITTRAGDYPFLDHSLEEPDVRVVRTSTPTYGGMFRMVAGRKAALPYGDLRTASQDSMLKRLMYWTRTNLVVPDARVMWAPFATGAATRELRRAPFDAVVTTGPPHSTHLTGLQLKRRFGRPWLADFRDPWSRISWLSLGGPSRLTRAAHERLERRVFAASDAQTIFSPYFADIFPPGDKHVLYNGYDEREMEGLEHRRSDRFRIKYVGRITAGRDITPLLDALQAEAMPDAELSLVGVFEQPPEDILHGRPGIRLRNVPFGPHRQALDETMNAEVVVLLSERYADTRGIIPLKLFEYIGSRTFILGLGDVQGESAALLRRYGAGEMLDYDDTDGIRRVLRQRYDLWRNGHDDRNHANVSELSVTAQTERLAQILERMT
ncbi:MAG: glycosyl transferase [Candidatus Cloacimonetes bacterium]|nr:glycosyl transferase [Candidatus Cloacimonadota bacterium]